MKILFFGDIVGKIGRSAIKKKINEIKKTYKPDLILANGENLAHGTGFTKKTVLEMQQAGIDCLTMGNHVWDNKQGVKDLKTTNMPIILPANMEQEAPGKIWQTFKIKKLKIAVFNLLGEVFINKETTSLFKTADAVLEELNKEEPDVIIVDLHAETTSEKQALWYYLDGRVNAVVGTHTHVATANPRVSKKGTALVEDVGFVGAEDAVLGARKENILRRFLNNEKLSIDPPEKGKAIINAVLITVDDKPKKTKTIKRIDLSVSI